ncbi:MAG TPA: hypothetical protein VD908_13165 [Cytophagales bacterium]|nr:hypothetical protein [Cytophagales bacterium]
MENDKNKSGDPVKNGLNNEGYISKQSISNEEVEKFETKDKRAEKQGTDPIPESEVSSSHMDSSISKKGMFSVQESNLSLEEKKRFDKKAEDVDGGGDIGEGRGSGSDRA